MQIDIPNRFKPRGWVQGRPSAVGAPQRKRFVLQVHITGFCNNHCTHCYQQAAPQVQMALRDFRELMDQLAELVEQLEDEQDTPWSAHVNMTGGEPLMHPLFAQMAFEVWTRGFSLGVLTNGSLVSKATACLLKSAEFVQVSLDGARATHDAIRGKGDYDRVIAAIRTLKAEGCQPIVSFTACSSNFRELPAVAKAAKAAGATGVWTDRYLPLDPKASMRPLSPEETEEYLKLVAKLSQKRFGIVTSRRALQQLYCEGPIYRCHAARNLLAVDENCRILACRRLPIDGGDFREITLSEAYFENQRFKELRHAKAPEDCQSCERKKACAGGLRCLSAAQLGDWRLPDPGCPLQRGNQ